MTAPRLTSLSPAGGCGCKLGPLDLQTLLAGLSGNLASSFDDAAVFPGVEDASLLFTVDFFTPLVDDAREWGAIAAANALSDIYAMGGRPQVAMAIAGWPVDALPIHELSEALAGAETKFAEADTRLVGGHTIRDSAPKLGFAVVGQAQEHHLMRKSGGRIGDALVLTKPIGSGTVISAHVADHADAEVVSATVRS